ncbi:DJ-1 family glyoxalase III [Cellulosilyticum ruminicola]|uniref:DJ-1 family glyoxalase III n=1 Tax=Cellulosilyticum ruminicola TaxID=425254 RepID=UPI0006D154A5|nr:DJ-1 family glyoxalase III [Cellulosilyticum ruminicola]
MKVAVYFATGYEEVEALAVVDVLRRGGVDVSMVGVTGKAVASARQISINMDQTIDEVNHDEIDMMVLPGGIPGVDNLKANETLVENLKAFKKEGKWIAAICAGPTILGELGLLEGEKATCYPGCEDALTGATVVNERAVVSNKIITGKGAGAALEFGLAILSVIKGEEAACKIAKAMIVSE